MRGAILLALAGIVRAPAKTALRVLALALATALLGSMLLFVGSSLRTMTSSAVGGVPVDWQGPVASQAQAQRIASSVAEQSGIVRAIPAATAPFVAAHHVSPAGSIASGSGSVMAVPSRDSGGLRTFRMLDGALRPHGVVLDQQFAATLQARVGDTVTLTPAPGAPPRAYRVSGVAVVTAPDLLFQPLNPLVGPAPAQPPAQIAIMSLESFTSTYARSLRPIRPASLGSAAVPGAQTGIQWQVLAQVDRSGIVSSPSQTLTRETRIRNRVERVLTGQVQFVDNLADSLTTAVSDALYAEALFIMLALPGALVALGLVYLAALGTAAGDRRDLALLRARGASRRTLVALAAVESLGLGLVGGLLGAGLALVATSALVPGGVELGAGRTALTVTACLGLAIVGAFSARLAASAAASAGPVGDARRPGQRYQPALWQRLWVDVLALALSGLIYWLTARTGFSAIVNPDSNPTLSLAVYMFFAPALLWVGATLLLTRVRGRAVAWLAGRGAGRRPTTLSAFLLASAGRRGAEINRGLVLVSLLLAFGVNLGLFTATYDQQARVDAQLTIGADVVASAPPGTIARRRLAATIATVPGVASVSAVDHSYAYVGPDLQDVYGIDPATIGATSRLRDSYFLGGTAAGMLDRLRARPDGVLVSRETITDYSVHEGDLLRLRVLDRSSGQFRVVGFHVVGTVQEFPSAPKDSFMVANLGYLSRVAHDGGPNVVFARASGNAADVAARVAAATRADGTSVRNIREQTQQTVSSITAVDLSGIARIESAFTIVLAVAAIALFVGLGLAERRRELATMSALGIRRPQVAAFLWSETALVLGAGLALAAGLGWLLASMLVAMLRHVFDPPPEALAIPWDFLGALGASALGAAIVSGGLAAWGIGRLRLGAILREQ